MQVEISSKHPLPDFLGIPWGASQKEAKQKMLKREGVFFDEQRSGKQNLVFTGGLFANKDVQMWVLQFSNDGLHTAKILIAPPASILEREYQDLTARLSREYGKPVQMSLPDKKLYTFGKDENIEGSILCQIVPEGQILTTYQHQRLNKKAMSEMTGLDAPIAGMPASTQPRSGGGCFIATATLGHFEHPTVVLLSRFRDEVLSTTNIGQLFVRSYYAISPPLARLIENSKTLKRFSYQWIIRPAAYLAQKALEKE